MPATVTSATEQASVPDLALGTFKGQFNVGSMLDKFALPVLDQQRNSKGYGALRGAQRPKENLQDSLQVTEKLLQQFDR